MLFEKKTSRDVPSELDIGLVFLLVLCSPGMVSVEIKSYFDRIFSTDKRVLKRICNKILPRIHQQVEELIVEQYSMKRILHAVNYPQLYSMSLINCRAKILLKYLTGIVLNFVPFTEKNNKIIRY